MARKPYKKASRKDGQKGIYQCKNCKKIFYDSPKGINSKDFCSEQCARAYEERQRRKKSFDGKPIFSKEELLDANK